MSPANEAPAAAPEPLPAPAIAPALEALVRRLVPGACSIARLRRLTAGATLQTWSLDAVGEAGEVLRPLVLRHSPTGLRTDATLPLAAEAALLRALVGSSVPVAEVVHTLVPGDALGEGFLMVRLEGETIARKIQRDAAFAPARQRLVQEMGSALGAIHRVAPPAHPALPTQPPLPPLPPLPALGPAATLSALRQQMDATLQRSAVFEFAHRWLQQHLPAEPAAPCLVHGDFRLGNLMIDGKGLVAVLDWELAHLGDPAEDLAWACLPPWRFGAITQPVAGLGQLEELLRAWSTASGRAAEPARIRWWQVLGSLRWGLMCAGMRGWFASGRDASVERAMIARRASESELDLLRLLASEDPCA